ncbi:RNA-binding protein 8A-like [Tachypleus tridentatus]|uniref:RNA-binding protein 8A-like n=1 Tax=Tachypleus tridentatus TaxID=6853 RepID=UPI003FCF250A
MRAMNQDLSVKAGLCSYPEFMKKHKGYALVEYKTVKEANAAIEVMDGSDMFRQTIRVDWFFCERAS